MYRAKRAGGHRLELFDESLRREAESHLQVERRLREALPRKELELAYQPIFALDRDDRAVACEALLRWYPQEGNPVPPAEFLTRAQESGLIVPIGEWVLDSACRQASAWRAAGRQICVSVNVSARGLTELDLAARLHTALARYELDPSALWIEVTESSLLGDPERARTTLAQVRAAGVRVALDRAGAHETRLELIDSLPLDSIKLDRALIDGAEDPAQPRPLASALIALARESGIDTVAVGVQSDAQLALARRLGCTHVQGFLLGEPQPAEQVTLRAPGAVGSLARWGPLARLHHRP
jgi:EAL domain-containing protein (putative c-di-GMP-specific phosphodiesterase class I)